MANIFQYILFQLINLHTLAALGIILGPPFKILHFQDANARGKATQTLITQSLKETAIEDFDFWLHPKQFRYASP